MKRYLLTSPDFNGEIEVVYRNGRFVRLDFMEVDLSDKQTEWLLRNVPPLEAHLQDMVAITKKMVLVEREYQISLDDFKRAYPYKRNSHLLPPIWDKMTKTDQVLAELGARKYRQFVQRQHAKGFTEYTPMLATRFLKEQQWLNDWDNS
jgi:hypothetical protein